MSIGPGVKKGRFAEKKGGALKRRGRGGAQRRMLIDQWLIDCRHSVLRGIFLHTICVISMRAFYLQELGPWIASSELLRKLY